MSQFDSKLLWLKDMLNHLRSCHQQLEWTEDDETRNVVLETMLRDLDCCKRLCMSLQRKIEYAQTA